MPIPSANIAENRGLRIVHMLFENPRPVSILLMLYSKSEMKDVTRVQVKRALEHATPGLIADAQHHGVDPQLFRTELAKILAEFA